MGKLTALTLTLAVAIATSPASARCIMSYCKDGTLVTFGSKTSGAATTSTPTRSYIVNTHRQKVGDIYDPGHGRRLQLRDNDRRIVGYVEADGTVTNTSRQPVARIELD